MTTNKQKVAYTEAAEARLTELSNRLAIAKNKVRAAVVRRHTEVDDRLSKAERQADNHLFVAKDSLDKIRQIDRKSWGRARKELEDACEGLSECIKRLIVRFY